MTVTIILTREGLQFIDALFLKCTPLEEKDEKSLLLSVLLESRLLCFGLSPPVRSRLLSDIQRSIF